MSIFSGLSGEAAGSSTVIDPKRLFRVLPKPSGNFKFPHDIQSEVWDKWFAARSRPDVILKMNTGSGKTVVGLVILKSSLNEGKGPAVYLVPNTQLQAQVIETAAELGIETTTEPRDGEFRRGRAVLVVPVHTMYNGKTKFRLQGRSGNPIEVGTVVVDDAHACIPIIEDQFSLSVPDSHPAYDALRELFSDALKVQSLAGSMGLENGTGSQVVPVPYWEWQAKVEPAMRILAGATDIESHDFDWPMLEDHLVLCEAAFAPKAFEVRLPYPNIAKVPSYVAASRRIYMTATLADDSVLISKMGVSSDCVLNPITPSSASDLGDRIILTPSETSRSITHEQIRESAAAWGATHNVVVVVPSRFKAAEWAPYTSEIHYKNSIKACIERLRAGHVGLVVLVNRYDGVDLPNDACRILILDGLPGSLSLHEQVEATAVGHTPGMRARQVQRIEQGMGRGIRSTGDYCAVVLLDPRLVEYLYTPKDLAHFSPGTRAQFDLSTEFASAGQGKTMAFFGEAIEAFLSRDPGWTEASKSVLEDVVYERPTSVSPLVVAERTAFEHALAGRYGDAFATLQMCFGDQTDHGVLGWVKQRAATYLNLVDQTQARDLQRSARIDNNFILKVEGDGTRERLRAGAEQAEASAAYVAAFESGTALEVAAESLLRDLEPSTEKNSHKRFEKALDTLASLLGFNSSRPDQETGVGPDNFWCIGNGQYWVIECKSESTSDSISRSDLEQLSHSVDWFNSEYNDPTLNCLPVMIHNSRRPNWDAVPRQSARVVPFDVLADLRAAVRAFVTELASDPSHRTPAAIRESLVQHRLNAAALEQQWTKEFAQAVPRSRA